MGRLPRIYLPGLPVHVIQRGNNRGDVFRAEGDFQRFLQLLALTARRFEIDLHAYVLMTNHFHLLATPVSQRHLGRMMQSLGIRYVQFFNAKYSRTGTLWEGRYKSTLVDSESYFLACSRYIELNPVRAGLVKRPNDYRWSSFRGNALGERDDLLRSHEVFLRLGESAQERLSAYRALFDEELQASVLCTIRDCTQRSWLLGRPDLGKEVLAKTGRRPFPAAPGRRKGWRKLSAAV
jgi:putative transposase